MLTDMPLSNAAVGKGIAEWGILTFRFGLRYTCTCRLFCSRSGVLSGAIVSGVQLAIASSNSGGAWDNAKKKIEADGHRKTEVSGEVTASSGVLSAAKRVKVWAS